MTDLITTAQAAGLLNVTVPTIHRMILTGRLTPAVKLPGKTGAYLFDRLHVDAQLEQVSA